MADCSGLDLLGHRHLCFTLSAPSSSSWARCCFQKHFSARGAHLQVRTWAFVPCGTGPALAPRPSAAPESHQRRHPVPAGHSQQHEDSPTVNHCPRTLTKGSTCFFGPVSPRHPHALGALGIIPRGGTGHPLNCGRYKAVFAALCSREPAGVAVWAVAKEPSPTPSTSSRSCTAKKSQAEQRLHLKNSLVEEEVPSFLDFFCASHLFS